MNFFFVDYLIYKAEYILVLYAIVFALNFCVGNTVLASTTAPDFSGFVVLTDIVPDAIMEARYYTLYNFIGDRVRGYEEPIVLVTREAANALREVNNELLPLDIPSRCLMHIAPRWRWIIL